METVSIFSPSSSPRKYFMLTEKGAAFYKELETTWQELADAVEMITSDKNLTKTSTSTNQ